MAHIEEKKLSKKKTIILLIIAIWLILGIPGFVFVMQRIMLTHKSLEYIKPYEEMAIQYVKTETNAAERYGYTGTLELNCNMRMIDYKEDNAKYNTIEEFENSVVSMEIYVDVNERATCVVVFELDEQDNKLKITRHFWE